MGDNYFERRVNERMKRARKRGREMLILIGAGAWCVSLVAVVIIIGGVYGS